MKDFQVSTVEKGIKTFEELRNEADEPLIKLYYEILSRFHTHDYKESIDSMSENTRQIIEDCTLYISNHR